MRCETTAKGKSAVMGRMDLLCSMLHLEGTDGAAAHVLVSAVE